MKKYILVLWLFCPTTALAYPCSPTNRGMQTMQQSQIVLLDDDAQEVKINTLIADDNIERASGYQYICPNVIQRTTILFRWDQPIRSGFHMHNVKAPLDIGFFDGNGVLIQYMQMYPYVDSKEILYGPIASFQYALEARLGFFSTKNLSAGSTRLKLDSLP